MVPVAETFAPNPASPWAYTVPLVDKLPVVPATENKSLTLNVPVELNAPCTPTAPAK